MAIHNLTTLLADTGATAASFTPGSLSYTLSGTTAADNTLVMQKSDGSYWLSLWNESDAAHNVTLSLGGASEIKVFDPLTGTAVLQDVRNTASASFAVADHPVIVQVIGASGAPPASGAVLTVGPGQQYASIAAAVAAARAGDTVNVQAGTYTNDFVNVYKNITLQAVGGVVKMLATVNPPNGKAIIDEGGSGVNITINGFDISGAVVADGNGAAIRYEGGTLTLNNDYIHNNQDGLLSAADPAGRISINASEFAYNGKGDGYTHNLYVGDIASLSITNSYFHDASEGHEIKSRAESTTITGSRIYDNNSTASYSVDLPNGGNATIQNDVIQQGPNSDNPAIISYGEEGSLHAGTTVVIANNTIVNARTGSAVGVVNQAPYAVTLQGNSVYGLTSSNLTSGTATVSGTSYLLSSPTLDTSSSWMPAAPPPGPTPNDLVVATPASESLVAGTSLVVSGVSISDPWAAATPGTMTLNVWDAGGGTIAMAGQTATSSGRISVSGTLAQLNTWLAGLSYTAGASQGGDTITVDVWNQAGIEVQKAIGVTVAAPPPPPPPPPAASITTGSGSDTLVLSMSEDAYQGDAKFTVTVDGRQLGGTYTATAPHAAGGSQNFTFMGDWASGTHTVAVNFLNDAWGGTAATDRNLYVNGISYDGAATGQSAALMGAGPKSFALTDGTAVPAAVTGSGSDSLVLEISEDAYLGNAQFTVAVDGRQLGGTFTATALHGSGASQAFVFKGDFGPGAHAVAVKFLNDAWAGTPATDRNLYVDSVTYRGANTTQSAALLSAGARIFAVSGGTTPSVSETSDHGSLQKNLAQTGSYSVGGDTFVLSSGNAASVTLGTAPAGSASSARVRSR